MTALVTAAIELRGEYLLVFGVVFAIVVAYSLYTRRGSGIDHHPVSGQRSGAPGAAEPPRMSIAEDEPEHPADSRGER